MRGHDEVRACLSDVAHRRRMGRFTWIRRANLGTLRGLVTPTPRPYPPHDLEACAGTVLPECLPEVQACIEVIAR